MNTPIHVAIADDHQSVVDGYRYRLEHLSDDNIEVVGTAKYAEELEALLANHPTDVLILDVSLPISENNASSFPILYAIPDFLQRYNTLSIIVISMHIEGTLIDRVIKAGAKGYIVKDDQQSIKNLGNIIKSVAHSGGTFLSPQAREQWQKKSLEQTASNLTPRQLEVLSLCIAHPELTTRDLADILTVQHSTVRNLLSRAFKRLEVPNRASAVKKVRKLGILAPPQKSPTYE